VRDAELWIDDFLEVRAERAVLIGAQSRSQEQAIADPYGLFEKNAECLAVARRVVGELRGTGVVRHATGCQIHRAAPARSNVIETH
jgi:hypothetical protein